SRLFNIINKNVDGIVVVDPDGIVRFVNPAIESIVGLKSEELLGELFGFPVVAEKTTELNIIHKSGKIVYVEMRVVVTEWEGQIAYIASLRDITKRKQAEEKINQQNIFLNTVIESIHNPFYVIDANDYKIKMANTAAKSGNLIENPTCYAITHKRNKPCDETEYVCPLRELKKNKKPVVVEHIHCDKDGNYRDVEVHGYPIFDSEGNVSQMIEYTLDITERKNLQEQLRHSQKMEAIGQLAGGIAHKFNNFLMALSGYSELLLNHLNEDDPLYENAGKIKEVTYRAASLTRELLVFSRKQNLNLEILDLNNLVIETEKMLKPFIGMDIEIVTLLEPELGQVKADSDQIEQVIMNLAVNARDVMPKGGILTIQTQNMTIDEKYCRAFPESKPGRFVCLVIKDTGVGMDREIIKHIFEPFFSTKARGKGTGLGLSTVYGIIKQHAGWITVKSKPGKGSAFSIFLPSVEKTLK
ncbi:MAG: PAS domain S-box protein, partial [Candidatus Heimdallarchaeota archaeon]|nr:PAS domain S-box protein [Candidatus Heimdallarchaeota archaeon]